MTYLAQQNLPICGCVIRQYQVILWNMHYFLPSLISLSSAITEVEEEGEGVGEERAEGMWSVSLKSSMRGGSALPAFSSLKEERG